MQQNYLRTRSWKILILAFRYSIDEREINDAASCQFIRDKHNLILIGDSGTGKTHLSIG